MNNILKSLGLAAVVIYLSGCTTAPTDTHYYLLNSPADSATKSPQATGSHVVLQSLKLAEYLQSQHIVMQLNSNKLQFSSKHLWAENLQTGIEKALLERLNTLSNTTTYLNRNQLGDYPAQQLFIEFNHFLITEKSTAIAAGTFWLKDSKQTPEIEPFYIELDLSRDGYPHAIDQLRKTLDLLAEKIHRQI